MIFVSSTFFNLNLRLDIFVLKILESDTIKFTHNRIIILYSKYVVCDKFIFDFFKYFLWNIFNSKRVKVYNSISVNK